MPRPLAPALLMPIALALSAAAGGETLPLESFFGSPSLTRLSLSPDGSHAAAIAPRDDAWKLVVIDLASTRIVREIDTGARPILDAWWVDDDVLLLCLSFRTGREARLAAVGWKGGTGQDFGTHQASGGRYAAGVSLLSVLPASAQHVLVSFLFRGPGSATRAEAARLDLYSGAFEVEAGAHQRALAWRVDPTGAVRLGEAEDAAAGALLYRAKDGDPWQRVERIGGRPVERLTLRALGFTDEGAPPVVASRHRGDRFALYRFDPERGALSEPIFAHPRVDVAGPPVFSRRGRLRGVGYRDTDGDGTWQVHWLDPVWQARARRIDQALAGASARIVDWSDDETKFLVRVESDTRAPLYVLYSEKPVGIRSLASLHPGLPPEALVETRRVTLPARDGRELGARLTLPRGGGRGLPAVVVVHDGPWTAGSEIRLAGAGPGGFDPEVQFLANRGYAVLQPEFRGASGLGLASEQAGFGEWGGAMQDDLSDAVAWLVAEGLADPKRVCITGQGYGAYAAVMGLVSTPTLYRCAIAYDGVYALESFLDQVRDAAHGAEVARRMALGREQLAARSPVRRVESLRAPLLLAYGAEPGEGALWIRPQYDALVAAMQAAGKPYASLELPRDGEGLGREANRLRFYRAVEAFLAEQLAPAP